MAKLPTKYLHQKLQENKAAFIGETIRSFRNNKNETTLIIFSMMGLMKHFL